MSFLRVKLIDSTSIFFSLEIVVTALKINSLDSFLNSLFQCLANSLMCRLFKICVIISPIVSRFDILIYEKIVFLF